MQDARSSEKEECQIVPFSEIDDCTTLARATGCFFCQHSHLASLPARYPVMAQFLSMFYKSINNCADINYLFEELWVFFTQNVKVPLEAQGKDCPATFDMMKAHFLQHDNSPSLKIYYTIKKLRKIESILYDGVVKRKGPGYVVDGKTMTLIIQLQQHIQGMLQQDPKNQLGATQYNNVYE